MGEPLGLPAAETGVGSGLSLTGLLAVVPLTIDAHALLARSGPAGRGSAVLLLGNGSKSHGQHLGHKSVILVFTTVVVIALSTWCQMERIVL